VGPENVGAPQLLDTHRPDAYRMSALSISKSRDQPLRPKLVLRRFRPPQHAQVWTDRGKPVRVFSPIGGGKVTAFAGPWFSDGDWWTKDAWDREEWDVEICYLGTFRISQDFGRWVLDGSYD
jgi:protein ImuB